MPERGGYDRRQLNRVLDEGFICHVAFQVEGEPFVIPTSYARLGDRLLLHGSAASRMLRLLDSGVAVCVCVTILDGLVLARSAFHHSMNYRSAVIFGTAVAIDDPMEKRRALEALSEHIIPGRWDQVRQPSDQELKATLVLAVGLDEFSVKTRTGPPLDNEEDYELPVWAGVLPFNMEPGEAMRDPRQNQDAPTPEYVRNYRRARGAEN